jgi:hypothetical protein
MISTSHETRASGEIDPIGLTSAVRKGCIL